MHFHWVMHMLAHVEGHKSMKIPLRRQRSLRWSDFNDSDDDDDGVFNVNKVPEASAAVVENH